MPNFLLCSSFVLYLTRHCCSEQCPPTLTSVIWLFGTPTCNAGKNSQRHTHCRLFAGSQAGTSNVDAEISPFNSIVFWQQGPPPEYTEQRSQSWAARADRMLIFYPIPIRLKLVVRSASVTRFCWTDSSTHRLKVSRFLLNWPMFGLCIPGFTYRKSNVSKCHY